MQASTNRPTIQIVRLSPLRGARGSLFGGSRILEKKDLPEGGLCNCNMFSLIVPCNGQALALRHFPGRLPCVQRACSLTHSWWIYNKWNHILKMLSSLTQHVIHHTIS